METQDWSIIGADCLVLSCCCQCLILQFLVFILLKLPIKLLRRIKQFVKKKLRNRVSDGRAMMRRKVARCAVRSLVKVRGCMEDVDKVFDEMSANGEFGFGSFWRGGEDDLEGEFPICLVNQQLGYHDHVGNYHFIQVFGPFTMH